MKKRIIALICSIVLISTSVFACCTAFANDVEWNYDGNTKTLYITGSGSMDDYTEPYAAPWGSHVIEMQNLVVEEGITRLGNYAFSGATSLANVTLADSITSIGEGTFSSTPSLLSLTMSPNISKIGDKSFATIGADDKAGFVLNAQAGSFALHYAVKNSIPFSSAPVSSGENTVTIIKNTGMTAYLPYVAPVDGTFAFYSVSKNDPAGYVYDSEFNRLAYNDDHGSALVYQDMEECDFSLSVNLTKGETYYFATKTFSPVLGDSFSVFIVPLSYNVTGNIRALISPDGTESDYLLNGATVNGEATDGTFSINVTSADFKCTFAYEGAEYTHTFNPDEGDSVDIAIVVCDQNSDGVVNIRDYAIMRQNNSAFLQYFDEFLNFSYSTES